MAGLISALVDGVKSLFAFHKFKIFMALMFTLLFFVLLFPFNDLADLVTTKVSDATGGSVYLQLDKMGLNIVPVGVQMETVSIENAQLPGLNMDTLTLSPWIMGALAFKRGATVEAGGLFKGNVHVTVHEGSKVSGDGTVQNVGLIANDIALPAVTEYLRTGNIASLGVLGSLNLETDLVIDPAFKDQPSGTLGAKISGLGLPSQSLMTAMGAMQTPALKLGAMSLKAKLGGGRIEIEEMTFGGSKEDLSGKIKGELLVNFQPDGRGGATPIVSTYNLLIDMTASKQFMDPSLNPTSGLLGGFLGQFRSETPQGSRFAFRMKQPKMPGQPPELSAN
jgi:type II secretion system protein N